eukprot:UN01060
MIPIPSEKKKMIHPFRMNQHYNLQNHKDILDESKLYYESGKTTTFLPKFNCDDISDMSNPVIETRVLRQVPIASIAEDPNVKNPDAKLEAEEEEYVSLYGCNSRPLFPEHKGELKWMISMPRDIICFRVAEKLGYTHIWALVPVIYQINDPAEHCPNRRGDECGCVSNLASAIRRENNTNQNTFKVTDLHLAHIIARNHDHELELIWNISSGAPESDLRKEFRIIVDFKDNMLYYEFLSPTDNRTFSEEFRLQSDEDRHDANAMMAIILNFANNIVNQAF